MYWCRCRQRQFCDRRRRTPPRPRRVAPCQTAVTTVAAPGKTGRRRSARVVPPLGKTPERPGKGRCSTCVPMTRAPRCRGCAVVTVLGRSGVLGCTSPLDVDRPARLSPRHRGRSSSRRCPSWPWTLLEPFLSSRSASPAGLARSLLLDTPVQLTCALLGTGYAETDRPADKQSFEDNIGPIARRRRVSALRESAH